MNLKQTFRLALCTATLASALCLNARAEDQLPGFVDFGKFNPGDKSEFVEVEIKSNLINMVTRLAAKSEPQVAEALKGLKGIRVNVIGLNDENRGDITAQVKKIRAQLDAAKWERLATVKQGKEDVGVYLKTRGEEAVEGIVVTVINGDEQAVLVNILGDIDPEKLAMVGERFGVDPLKEISAHRKNN